MENSGLHAPKSGIGGWTVVIQSLAKNLSGYSSPPDIVMPPSPPILSLLRRHHSGLELPEMDENGKAGRSAVRWASSGAAMPCASRLALSLFYHSNAHAKQVCRQALVTGIQNTGHANTEVRAAGTCYRSESPRFGSGLISMQITKAPTITGHSSVMVTACIIFSNPPSDWDTE